MNSLKISIIIIGYNIEKYLKNSIGTALNQDYDNYEVLFVNDGSKDNTEKLALELYGNNPRFKLINKENGGIVSARKKGLEEATGDYIFFMDGDDWLNTDCISNLASSIKDEEDIIVSDLYYQKKDKSFIIYPNTHKEEFKDLEYFDAIMLDKIFHFLFPRLYKRSFLLDAGYLSFKEVSMAEDLMTNALVGLKKPRVRFSKTVNYYYRYNDGSMTRNGSMKLLEQIKTLEYLTLKFKEESLDKEYYDKLIYQWFSYLKAYVYPTFNHKYKSLMIKEVKKRVGKGIKTNPYVLEYMENQRTKKEKLKLMYFKFYYKARKLGVFLDIFLKLAIKLYRFRNKAKAKSYKKKMSKYYQRFTNNLNVDNTKKHLWLIGTSDRSNIGDHAIAYSESEFLKKYFSDYQLLEVTGDHYRYQRDEIKPLVGKEDVLFITGGGFLGDLWMDEENMVRDVIKSYPNNKIIILSQTMFFTDSTGEESEFVESKNVYTSHKNLTIILRDKRSYDFASTFMDKKNLFFMPDMALFLNENFEKKNKENKLALICFRKDKEACLSPSERDEVEKILISQGYQIKHTSTLADGKNNGDIILENRKKMIDLKLEEFSEASIFVTDRLHGMVLSALAGCHTIAFDNSSHKVFGVYSAWLRDCENVNVLEDVHEFLHTSKEIVTKDVSYSYDHLHEKEIELSNIIKKIIEG